ncbi:MAG: NADH:ubiquinone reductase (Na(+)-transporting) subunit C [Bacteroides sp.]|nr:NADH:ubiquinone reductase (Na(+)-transporting) subunit C [Ruminococcus flavefaciens]MCM1555587.1 NADH:ubiquinone reductase (Na(+)-transporting) subunit C [Bacteroides sp.]
MFSNKYIFLYTSALVVAVAVVLALTASLLQPMQERNREVAKMQEILKAAGQTASSEDAVNLYNRQITSEWMVDMKGDLVSEYRNVRGEWKAVSGGKAAVRAFDCDLKTQLGEAAAGRKDVLFPVFVCRDTLYIVPLQGKGLWGPIWGYLALGRDFNTVWGATFGHKGETPGLGAEIAEDAFQSEFVGKKLFDGQGNFTSITVQKGGADKYAGGVEHAVDAISGGTMTSNGVTAMLAGCMEYYRPFFQNMKARLAAADTVAEQVPEVE